MILSYALMSCRDSHSLPYRRRPHSTISLGLHLTVSASPSRFAASLASDIHIAAIHVAASISTSPRKMLPSFADTQSPLHTAAAPLSLHLAPAIASSRALHISPRSPLCPRVARCSPSWGSPVVTDPVVASLRRHVVASSRHRVVPPSRRPTVASSRHRVIASSRHRVIASSRRVVACSCPRCPRPRLSLPRPSSDSLVYPSLPPLHIASSHLSTLLHHSVVGLLYLRVVGLIVLSHRRTRLSPYLCIAVPSHLSIAALMHGQSRLRLRCCPRSSHR